MPSDDKNWINLLELEQLAKPLIKKLAADYYASGSESESTLRDNRAAYARWRLVPRCMVDVSRIDMTCKLLGRTLSCPVLIAPVAQQCMAHPDGEIATVRAAAACGVGMVVSANGNTSLGRVAEAGGQEGPLLMYQLYVFKDRQFVIKTLKKAAAAGYAALVITVDTPQLGSREADERNKFQLQQCLSLLNQDELGPVDKTHCRFQMQEGLSLPNLDELGPVDEETRRQVASENVLQLVQAQIDPSLTWEFVAWCRQHWDRPIFIKGILSPFDAIRALEAGVDGLMLSNHGGRQLDGAPSALDMIPVVKAAVGNRVPILVDGGIRRGTDILKALALGADMVLLGRPVLHGLAVDGQAGVEKVLNTLKKELKLNMALAGRPTLAHITRDLVLGPQEHLSRL